MLADNAVSTAVIVEYSAGPASSAAAISNSVSSDEGDAPTNDVIPANTCDDRFATWLLSADEMDAVADDSAETLVAIAVDNDSTPVLRCATADARTDPCVETAVCTEVMDWVVPEMMDAMDAARAAALDPRFVWLSTTLADSAPIVSLTLEESAPISDTRARCSAPLEISTAPLLYGTAYPFNVVYALLSL